MKVLRTGAIATAIGTVLLLGACGGSKPSTPDQAYLDIESVKAMTCDKVDQTKLQQAINFNPNTSQAKAVMDLNPGMDSLGPLKDALKKKAEQCPGGSPSSSANPSAACPSGFTVKLDPNIDNNLLSGGVSADTEETRQLVIGKAKEDPRVLHVYYNASPLGKQTPIAKAGDIAPLQDGACYTEAGIKQYNDWLVLWKVAGLARDTLPQRGTNTGAMPGGESFQEEGFIPPSPGIKVTFYDAAGAVIGEHWVRVLCGQPVATARVPGLPDKPTDTPSVNCKDNDCHEQPPCTGDKCTTLEQKNPTRIPGNGGEGDGGTTKYPGGDGTVRHTAAPTPEPPKAGDPAATQQPAPPPPPANPVPSGTPAPPATTQPPQTSAPPPSAPGTGCVPTPRTSCP